jgi:DNA-damage-inducible protein D
MKQDIINSLTHNFESFVNKTKDDLEFWFARDLQHLLGYDRWENFLNPISKAKIACEISGDIVENHFRDVTKMVGIGSGVNRKIEDIALTRYACYLIAQNGDPSKEEIAFAQTYFAIQTRKAELIEKRISEIERLQARKKLSETEKELSSVIFQQTGGNKNFALIRSKGDTAFFGGKNTAHMKIVWKTQGKPIADFMPTVLLKAKDLATEITIYNAKDKRMKTEDKISKEHVSNNTSARSMLISRGLIPEQLPPLEDVKKVERKVKSEKKKEIDVIRKGSKSNNRK